MKLAPSTEQIDSAPISVVESDDTSTTIEGEFTPDSPEESKMIANGRLMASELAVVAAAAEFKLGRNTKEERLKVMELIGEFEVELADAAFIKIAELQEQGLDPMQIAQKLVADFAYTIGSVYYGAEMKQAEGSHMDRLGKELMGLQTGSKKSKLAMVAGKHFTKLTVGAGLGYMVHKGMDELVANPALNDVGGIATGLSILLNGSNEALDEIVENVAAGISKGLKNQQIERHEYESAKDTIEAFGSNMPRTERAVIIQASRIMDQAIDMLSVTAVEQGMDDPGNFAIVMAQRTGEVLADSIGLDSGEFGDVTSGADVKFATAALKTVARSVR